MPDPARRTLDPATAVRVVHRPYRWWQLITDLVLGPIQREGWYVVVSDGARSWEVGSWFSTPEDAAAVADAFRTELGELDGDVDELRRRHRLSRARGA